MVQIDIFWERWLVVEVSAKSASIVQKLLPLDTVDEWARREVRGVWVFFV